MARIVRCILYLVTIVTVNGVYDLNEFDLPGIFSNSICENDGLKKKLMPICRCRELIKVTDIPSLCRLHVKFGECVHAEIHEDQFASPYLAHVFSNRRFKQTMAHLCRKKSDANGITTCTKPTVPSQCNAAFSRSFQTVPHNISEQQACRLTEKTSECFWRIYENDCSPTVRYFWSKLSESYMSHRCSKHGDKSKGDKCTEIKDAFHPNPKTHSVEECHKSVHTMRECFELEKLSSIHHDDIWLNMEFELNRYIRFLRFRCDIKKEKDRNHHCEYPHRKRIEHCINIIYMDGFKKQTKQLQDGGNVTVQEICSVYDNTTTCIQEVLKDCAVNAIHLNSLFCGAMPTSCSCPVNLAAERLARSSRSSRQTSSTWTIIFCFFFAVLFARKYFSYFPGITVIR